MGLFRTVIDPLGLPQSPGPRKSDDFAETVSPYVGSLFARARRMLGSDDQAWDAVQDTLLSLWQERQPPVNLPAWLMRTVVHRSLHALRTRSRRCKHEKQAACRRPEASRRDDPVLVAERIELRDRLGRAFQELDEEHRRIVQLREVERLSYAAIAELLHIPVGTVRSRLNRSRSVCREILGPALPPG